MSIKLMTAVWPIDLRVSEKLVLLALADNANDEGYCWPLVSTLVTKCSLCERAVQQALANLTGAGHISIHRRQGRSNYFTVHPRISCTPQEMHPASSAPTPAPHAPNPLQSVHLPPASGAPITIIEPSGEPSGNRQIGKRATRADTAKRLPDDFELTPERQATARAEAVNPEREFARFCDHWRAASGASARKHDWDAAWRNWCRKANDLKPTLVRGGASISPQQLEADGLQKLKDRRDAIGLASFRDPSPSETAAQYRQAQDAEYNRLQQEQERRKAARSIADLTAAKRMST